MFPSFSLQPELVLFRGWAMVKFQANRILVPGGQLLEAGLALTLG